MFTGIVERIGTVVTVADSSNGRRFTIDAGEDFLADAQTGDSIAVDGVCLTAVALQGGSFDVEAIGTTLGRTTTGNLVRGARVNLERALPLGGRLGGHLVQGHVDGTGRVESITREGEHVLLRIALPAAVADVTVLHGSIAVHGVSLTVNRMFEAGERPGGEGSAEVALIPHTWENTTLQFLAEGDEVNLEGDMLGRFVVSYLRRIGAGSSGE